MNHATLQARVLILQQNIEIQTQQITSLSDNLKILHGHLGEAKHWLSLLGEDQLLKAKAEHEALAEEEKQNNIEDGSQEEE